MTINLNEILPLTRNLELSDRAKLAEQLLTSLDEPNEGEVEKLWIEEAKRRLTADWASIGVSIDWASIGVSIDLISERDKMAK